MEKLRRKKEINKQLMSIILMIIMVFVTGVLLNDQLSRRKGATPSSQQRETYAERRRAALKKRVDSVRNRKFTRDEWVGIFSLCIILPIVKMCYDYYELEYLDISPENIFKHLALWVGFSCYLLLLITIKEELECREVEKDM